MNKIVFFLFLLLNTAITNAQWQVIGHRDKSPTAGSNDADIFFVNDTLGFGNFHKTTDGGYTWQFLPGVYSDQLFFTDEQNGHSVTNTISNSDVYKRTIDGGNSWQDLTAALPGYLWGFYQVFFPATDTGYIISEQMGTIFKTMDKGTSWTIKYKNPYYFTSLFFPTSTIGYVTENGKILMTRNGGNDWDSTLLPFLSGQNAHPIVCASDTDNVYVIEEYSGKVIHSADGGYTWILQFSDPDMSFSDISFPAKDTGYIVGGAYKNGLDTGLVLKTTDGGNNWVVQPTGYNHPLYACHFISTDMGWAFSILPNSNDGEDVLYTANGGANTGTGEIKVENPVSAFPNPFSEQTTFMFTKETIGLLKIYDLLGKEIKCINFSEKQVIVERGNLKNGIYFYQIISEGEIRSNGKIIVQ